MRATPWDLAGRAALSVSAALWRDPRVGASVLGLPWVHLALVCGPRECALGLVKLVRLRLQAADACAAVPRSVSGLLPGGRICALGLRSLPEKVSSGLAETRRRCASVFGWVGGAACGYFFTSVNSSLCGATRFPAGAGHPRRRGALSDEAYTVWGANRKGTCVGKGGRRIL